MSNRALDGAERKGREARHAGEARDRCPYPDWRKADGRLTFSRAFRRAWFWGWDTADRCLLEHPGNIPAESGAPCSGAVEPHEEVPPCP